YFVLHFNCKFARNKYQTFMQNLVGAAEGGSVGLWSGKYYEHKIGKELRIRLIDFGSKFFVTLDFINKIR
ncbi:hypothetical protein, partial [Levilactobacillus brevis]|uniref:hypothetical protein n=1 Tax=Levilactobacillus brevis TaxID=1580 RepID=UPI001CDC0FE9